MVQDEGVRKGYLCLCIPVGFQHYMCQYQTEMDFTGIDACILNRNYIFCGSMTTRLSFRTASYRSRYRGKNQPPIFHLLPLSAQT